MLVADVAAEQIHFGEKALRLPAKSAPDAVIRVVRRFNDERAAGETFQGWLARNGGAKAIGSTLADLDNVPMPDENPGFYVDYDETNPFSGEVGDSECAV